MRIKIKSDKIGKLLLFLGLIFVLAALLLAAWNMAEEEQSAKISCEVNRSIQEIVEQRITENTEEKRPEELQAVEIDGYSYIGRLSIPTLELELPVIDHSTALGLRRAPCREYGTTADGMVIAGHNYKRHFGRIKNLIPGDLVKFIDMDGEETRYEVGLVDIIQPSDVDKVLDETWDLVLYTCTYGGQTRVMVGCRTVQQ